MQDPIYYFYFILSVKKVRQAHTQTPWARYLENLETHAVVSLLVKPEKFLDNNNKIREYDFLLYGTLSDSVNTRAPSITSSYTVPVRSMVVYWSLCQQDHRQCLLCWGRWISRFPQLPIFVLPKFYQRASFH